MAFFFLIPTQCDGRQVQLLEAKSEVDINHVLSVTQFVSSFTKLQGLKRQSLCSHTLGLHYMEYMYYNHSGLSLSLNQSVLHCINPNGMRVLRSLVYRTCWRREEEGQQRCWLNNVKPVSLFVQFFGSEGYYQKQPYLGGRHYKTHDPCPNMPQCFV